MIKANKIICALDLPDLEDVKKLVYSIEYDILYKFGMEFFYNFGIQGIEEVKKIKPNCKTFLDLKLHDIPNTVQRSIPPLLKKINPDILTIHSSGGRKMMEEAVKITNKTSLELDIKKPLLIGVTILTSLSQSDLFEMGLKDKLAYYVINYAELSKNSGLDGIVCSALETRNIKKELGSNFKIITPGIRMPNSSNEDQARVVTPKEAFRNGSDYIVMGRTLISSEEPNKIIEKIINDV